MEFMSWVTVGIMCVVGGGAMFIGAGIGHYNGYSRGFDEGSRKQSEIWKNRMAEVMRGQNAEH